MPEPLTAGGPVTGLGPGGATVTLVEGTSFCLSADNGDVLPGGAHGLFFLDTRFVSCLQVRIDGRSLEALGVAVDEPFAATFLSRYRPGRGAWAAATPLLFLRTLLRLEPSIWRSRVRIEPTLPPSMGRLRIEGIPIGQDRLTIESGSAGTVLSGLSPDMEVVMAGPHVSRG